VFASAVFDFILYPPEMLAKHGSRKYFENGMCRFYGTRRGIGRNSIFLEELSEVLLCLSRRRDLPDRLLFLGAHDDNRRMEQQAIQFNGKYHTLRAV
jgi:hypothetical protein